MTSIMTEKEKKDYEEFLEWETQNEDEVNISA